jgi:ribonuclease J
MRLRIHRGAKEIGGSCVELESEGHSLLLDLGLPLDAAGPDISLLPAIPGLMGEPVQEGGIPDALTTADRSTPVGVVVSHTHPDHIGLTGLLSPKIPVFLGAKAAQLMTAAQAFLPRLALPRSMHTYTDRELFQLRPFTIKPYLVDHSAFDAYSLLVEAGGRRVLYSGDLRAHGRKAQLVERLIRHGPRDLDALILEGTTLSRGDHVAQTEQALEDEIARHIQGSTGLVLAAFSAQNIDRFVTLFRATRRSGRVFVGDAYLRRPSASTCPTHSGAGSWRIGPLIWSRPSGRPAYTPRSWPSTPLASCSSSARAWRGSWSP